MPSSQNDTTVKWLIVSDAFVHLKQAPAGKIFNQNPQYPTKHPQKTVLSMVKWILIQNSKRIAEWRQEQVGQEQRLRTLMVNQRDNEALSSAISNMTNSGDNIVGHE